MVESRAASSQAIFSDPFSSTVAISRKRDVFGYITRRTMSLGPYSCV